MTLSALSADYDMKPCPFCCGSRVRIHRYMQHGEQFVAICLNTSCNAKGPRRYDFDEAMEAWNERSTSRRD